MRDSVKWDVAMVEEGGETERRVGGREISVGGGAIMGEWKRGCIWRWKVCGGVAVAWRIKKKKNGSHVENMGIGQEVRVWRNDKCAGQSIRSCQADGKLESWLDTETN